MLGAACLVGPRRSVGPGAALFPAHLGQHLVPVGLEGLERLPVQHLHQLAADNSSRSRRGKFWVGLLKPYKSVLEHAIYFFFNYLKYLERPGVVYSSFSFEHHVEG